MKKLRKQGFTLVELLIYMGILSILLGILTNIFVSALDVQLESEATTSVAEDSNYILSKLTYDLHRAQSIAIPNTLGGTAGNFQIVIGGVNYTYNIDGNSNLVLTNNLGTNNLNGYDTSISNLSVTRLGNAGKIEDTLDISFDITSRVKRHKGFEAKNLKTNLSLRR